MTDAIVISTVVWRAQNRLQVEGLSLVHANKLVACILVDFDTMRVDEGYAHAIHAPYAQWTPHNFGAVVSFPKGLFTRRCLLHDLHRPLQPGIGEPRPFWEILPASDGSGRIIRSTISLQERMSWLQGGQVKGSVMQAAHELEEFYAEFTVEELNVLATSRNIARTLRSADRELHSWIGAYGRFLHAYQSYLAGRSTGAAVRQAGIEHAVLARQMAKKIDDYERSVPGLAERIATVARDRLGSIAPIVEKSIRQDETPEALEALAVRSAASQVIRSLSTLTRYSMYLLGLDEDTRDNKDLKLIDYAETLRSLMSSELPLAIRQMGSREEGKPGPNQQELWRALSAVYGRAKELPAIDRIDRAYSMERAKLDGDVRPEP